MIIMITWFDDDTDYHDDEDGEYDDDEPGVTSVGVISTGTTTTGLLKIPPACHWSHIRRHLGEIYADYATMTRISLNPHYHSPLFYTTFFKKINVVFELTQIFFLNEWYFELNKCQNKLNEWLNELTI